MKLRTLAIISLLFFPNLSFAKVSCSDYAKASLAPLYYIRKSIPLSQARERAAKIYISEHSFDDAKTMLDIFARAYENMIALMKKRRIRPEDLSNEVIFEIGLKNYENCEIYLRNQDLDRLLQ